MGDRKGIHSEKGITDSFKRCREQGCHIIILDLDKHMSHQLLHPTQIAKYISWRPDFNGKDIHTYLVYRNKAVKIGYELTCRKNITAVIENLKSEQ